MGVIETKDMIPGHVIWYQRWQAMNIAGLGVCNINDLFCYVDAQLDVIELLIVVIFDGLSRPGSHGKSQTGHRLMLCIYSNLGRTLCTNLFTFELFSAHRSWSGGRYDMLLIPVQANILLKD